MQGLGGKIIAGARLGKANIEIDPVIYIVVVVMILSGHLTEYLSVLVSVFLHELGHIATTLAFGGNIYTIRIMPVGLNAVIQDSSCSRTERIIIYLSGPCINLAIILICIIIQSLGMNFNEIAAYLTGLNIGLLIFNLLPVLPLDGGRILKEMLSAKIGIFLASRYIYVFSCCLSALFIATGIFQFTFLKRNFSLILIGIYVFFALILEVREAAMMNVKNIVFRRSRLINKGIYPARDLVVLENVHMGEILKAMDHDRFHIIHVLDEELKFVNILTEQQVIDAMIKYNAEITFKEFFAREK